VKVSIVVTSYNHEKYIEQCLEAVLAQKGDFEMEIILGDDCSIDGTGYIMEEYQNKYPEIIQKLQNEKNLGITKNLKRCLDACTGDYIAICEGDDYWISDEKVQKQMQLLEAHPEYSMCFSTLTLCYQEEQRYILFSDQVNFPRNELTIEDLIKSNYIGNFSCCMYRAGVVHRLPDSLFKMFTVDWMFNMACSEMGEVGFIRESLSVYRRHSNGAWSGKTDIDQVSELIELTKEYNQYFQYRYDGLFKDNIAGLENWLAAKTSKSQISDGYIRRLSRRLFKSIRKRGAKVFKRTFSLLIFV
jgi:glycosyltransferase involved in cell wall biosynthesis